jgi:hypothetical protein
MQNLGDLETSKLLVLHAGIAKELRARRITRSSNNLVADLAEHLFCRAFSWKQAANSMKYADATDHRGLRYQIKARRITEHSRSRQLSGIRELPAKHFDVLAAVLFQEDYRVMRAALIPHDRVLAHAKHQEWTNSWIFRLSASIWSTSGVTDVTEMLRKAEEDWAEQLTHEPL